MCAMLCMYARVHAMEHRWRPEGGWREDSALRPSWGPEEQTQNLF